MDTCPYLLGSPTPSTCNSLPEVLLEWQLRHEACGEMDPHLHPQQLLTRGWRSRRINLLQNSASGDNSEVLVLTSFLSALVGVSISGAQWQSGEWYKLCFWPSLWCCYFGDITLPTKVCLVKAMVFPVVMYGCESWTIKKAEHRKNWCFWSVVLEKTLESPSDCKEIQPVHSKGNQSWIFIGRTDDETETPILWPPDAKNWLTGKDPDAGKDWRQENKGTTEDEMVGWHPQLNEYEFEYWI